MAMAMQERVFLGQRFEGERKFAGGVLARQKLFEHQGRKGEGVGFGPRCQRGPLIAHRQQAGRLQPNDRQAAIDKRFQRRAGTRDLGPAARHVAGRQIGAPAAERPAGLVVRYRQMHAVTGGDQHIEGGLQVFRFEIAVEGIGP